MCHQSVGLIARHLEEAGFPTVGLTSARSITSRANPPRSVFLDAPLGHTSGPPNEPDVQRNIVRAALEGALTMETPGSILDLDLHWHHDAWKADPLAWSRRREDTPDPASAFGQRSGDTRTMRNPEPRYQSDADRQAADAAEWDTQCQTCLGLPQPG